MRHFSLLLSICCMGLVFSALPAARAQQIDLSGPTGSDQFGATVTVLPNGNFVVTDPMFDLPGAANIGAVHLFDGVTLTIISTLTGSRANDQVGSGGITILSNGHYVVRSGSWDLGPVVNVGAVTWCSATTGLAGVVSAANSLIGSTANDQIGSVTVTPLPNGNYVVISTLWDNGPVANAGAATLCSGSGGTTGEVSTANSLVGGLASDQVGNGGIALLNNGNFVVRSTLWDNGAQINAGAVTWASGTTGVTGLVSAANSLIGSTANDTLGNNGVLPLSNGNYLIRSTLWDNGAVVNVGAVTWGSGTTGVAGEVSAANSLIGSTASDQIGSGGVIASENGNYVVSSPGWDDALQVNVGAATWGNGATGVKGEVSATNSLVGSTGSDQVGLGGMTALNNGHFVVNSPGWDDAALANVGAVTWVNGATGLTGAVSPANSLVGTTASDQIGLGGVTALNNAHYVVNSPLWDNGPVANVGAVTWANGMAAVTGAVSPANSLIGSTANDQVGGAGVIALNNGNYVVNSPLWDNGAAINAGAVTWAGGATGLNGVVSPANSLVGGSANDSVGNFGMTALNNGNYVVNSANWKHGTVDNAGAVTWGNGAAGVSGLVTSANSLVGSTANDTVGNFGVTSLSNGNYVVVSLSWDNGPAYNAGAVTWGNGTNGVNGPVSPLNSLVGSAPNDLVGSSGVTALNNGNYVVGSLNWDNGAWADVGAATWGHGGVGVTGAVSSANSLIGSAAGDAVGSGGVTALSDGGYAVNSPLWDNGLTGDAGAVSLGDGLAGTRGEVAAPNSVLGTASGGGSSMNFAYDPVHRRLIVGYPGAKRVSVLSYAVVLTPLGRTNGAFQFRVTGPTGPNYVILASTNLVDWSSLTTNIAPALPFQFTDANAVSTERRFYRVRLQWGH